MSVPSSSAGLRSEGGIGAVIHRREDERFVSGRGRYVGDIEVPHALHAVFLRSPHAHARIVRIDDSGHLIMADQPARFRAELRGFLAK